MNENTITLKIDPQLERDCTELLGVLGLNIQTAFDIFIHQVYNYGGLPFEVRQPNCNLDTLIAMRECEDILSGKIPSKVYDNLDEMWAELDSEDDEDEP